MDNQFDIINRISFLSRAESRVRVLETLSTADSMTQRALRDEVPLSRSAISRAVDSLAEMGWVTEGPDGVRLTPVGRLVIAEFLDLVESVEAAEELAPFLDWFPLSEYEIGIDELQDGTVTVASDGDPYAPTRKHRDLLQTTGQFRALLPSLGIDGIREIHRRMLDGVLESEFIVPSSVEATIRTPEFAPLFEEMLATGRLSVRITESVPFFLGLGDDGATQIGVEDDEGLPRALFETSTESVRSWAEDLFTDYRRSSDQLTGL